MRSHDVRHMCNFNFEWNLKKSYNSRYSLYDGSMTKRKMSRYKDKKKYELLILFVILELSKIKIVLNLIFISAKECIILILFNLLKSAPEGK